MKKTIKYAPLYNICNLDRPKSSPFQDEIAIFSEEGKFPDAQTVFTLLQAT